MPISCAAFTNFLARRTEHLDDEILRDIVPIGTMIGSVETGSFPALDGVSHTWDRLNWVAPDMSTSWVDVTATGCVGTPCDPAETKIGLGSTRDSYKLQSKSYASDLICYDLAMTADRAVEVFENYVSNLRDATTIINDNRLRNEYFRIAGNKWATTTTGLVPFTFTEAGDLINVTPSVLPTSALFTNHLRNRVQYQLLSGALGKNVEGMPPVIEVSTDMQTIWDLIQGNQTLTNQWRFEAFEAGSKEYSQYGWAGRVGNFMLKADLMPIRFQILGNQLIRVFPYVNIAATLGIKRSVNQAYIDAPVQASFIWHRRAMKVRMRDNTSINPMMPFAARDFGGKWQFVMDNLTCGTSLSSDGLTVPIAVDNSRRNKGKFIADFAYATQAQYPEFAEIILHLRAQPCVVGALPCGYAPTYVTQNYSSSNTLCP